jgi:peptide/nickel transport system permease protein
MRYVARRFGNALLLLVAVSLLSFISVQFSAGEFFSDLRLNSQVSAETISHLREAYGLHRPLHVRYLHWLAGIARGELGFSFAYNMPVAGLFRERAANTLLLTATGTMLAWVIALPLGVWAAARQHRVVNAAFSAGTSALLSVPDLVLGLALLLLALRTGWFPTGGMQSAHAGALQGFAKFQDTARHLALPCFAVAFSVLPILLRHIRASMVEALCTPHVRAARAHGLPEGRILWHYALRAASNPLISLFGFSIGALISASFIIEVIMSWPGLGPLLLESILARDLYVVVAAIMLSTVFLVVGNLFADIVLYAADPRIRREAL